MVEIYLHDVNVDNVPSNPKSDFPDTSKVQIFGCNSDGDPVYCEISGFRPWFYVESENLKELL